MPGLSPTMAKALWKLLQSAAVKLAPAAKQLGKNVAERAAYGAAGYGTGAGMERIETAHGKQLTPEGVATMRVAPAISAALVGPRIARMANTLMKGLTGATALVAPAWLPSVTDPAKKALGTNMEAARRMSGTVPAAMKNVSDAAAGFIQAVNDPYDPAGATKKLLEPSINVAVDRLKTDVVPAATHQLAEGLKPTIVSTAKQVGGGILGGVGAHALGNWLLPKDVAQSTRGMSAQQADEAYNLRKSKETRRKALLTLVSTLGAAGGAMAADPSSIKYWAGKIRGK